LRRIRDVAFMRLRNFGKFRFRNFHMKLTDCVTCGRCVRLNASAMTALQQTWRSFVPSVIADQQQRDALPHTKWASRRRKMPDLLLRVELRLTNGQCRLWVIFDRGGGLCRAADFRFAPKADVRS
jgi:hypothetical protein